MRKLKNEELGRIDINAFKKHPKIPLIAILDDVRSRNNIGAIFRTADAFLIQKIFLCGITATPPHKDIQKTALDATESVDWEFEKNIIDVIIKLKKEGVKIIAVEQTEKAVQLQNFSPKENETYAFIFGNEIKGVSQEAINLCDATIEIPQEGTKHSLNISAAASICFWDFYFKIKSHLKHSK